MKLLLTAIASLCIGNISVIADISPVVTEEGKNAGVADAPSLPVGDCILSDDFSTPSGLWSLGALHPTTMNVSVGNNRLNFWSPSENSGLIDAFAYAISDGWKIDMTQDWAVSAKWRIEPPTPDYGDVGVALVLVLEGNLDDFYIERGYTLGGGVFYDPGDGIVDKYESTNLWYDGVRQIQTSYTRTYTQGTTYIWYVASSQRIYHSDVLYSPIDEGVSLAGVSDSPDAWIGMGGYSMGYVSSFDTDSLWGDNFCIISGHVVTGDGDATGACCINQSCEILSGKDCLAGGGVYQGDNTDCKTSNCGDGDTQETWDVSETYPVTDPDPCPNGGFGPCIIKGNVMVTSFSSCQGEPGEPCEYTGLVVFERDELGSWSQNAFMEVPGADGESWLLYDLTADDDNPEMDRIVVTVAGASDGQVHMYERNADGVFTYYQEIENPDANGGGEYGFGSGIAIDGRNLVVGNPSFPYNGNYKGTVYAFRKKNSGVWEHAYDWKGANNDDQIGDEVGIHGDTVVFQTERSSSDGGNNKCYLYNRINNTTWELIQTINENSLDLDTFTEGGVLGDVLIIIGSRDDDPEFTDVAFFGLFKNDGTVGEMHNIDVRPEDESEMYGYWSCSSHEDKVLFERYPEDPMPLLTDPWDPVVDQWSLSTNSPPVFDREIFFPNSTPGGWGYDGESIYDFSGCELRRFSAIPGAWTVDDDGEADFDNIQAAVDAASDGDEIIVMPGTYTSTEDEVVDMLGKEVWLHSSKGAQVTIIDGEGARRGIHCNNNETSNTIIEGFTITNGYANDGGGIENYNNSNPTLTDCTFTGNTANNVGGGMYNYDSSPTLENCIFTGNSADWGGGMHNELKSSRPTLTNCTFNGNTANEQGGGMSNYSNSSPTLENCTFTGNTANDDGGGMYNWTNSSPTLTECTFENNSAVNVGGGMFNDSADVPTLSDCTFNGNTAGEAGGGMYNYDSSPALTDTTVCSNTPDDIYGDWTDNGGNMVAEECPLDCPDINSDGNVDVGDLLAIIDQWGLDNSPADVNDDGIVDVSDLLMVVGNWGPCE